MNTRPPVLALLVLGLHRREWSGRDSAPALVQLNDDGTANATAFPLGSPVLPILEPVQVVASVAEALQLQEAAPGSSFVVIEPPPAPPAPPVG